MKRYEYKIVALDGLNQDIEEELNKLGEEGWEVYLCRERKLLMKSIRENSLYKKEMDRGSLDLMGRKYHMINMEYFMEFHLKRIKEG